MTKPNTLKETYLIYENKACGSSDHVANGHGQLSQDLLHPGRAVWLECGRPLGRKRTTVPAYAEGIGLIPLRSGNQSSRMAEGAWNTLLPLPSAGT
jgi:hypothetical protein